MNSYTLILGVTEGILFFRVASDAVYENVDLEELMMQLREAENLEEQGDILHYLVW